MYEAENVLRPKAVTKDRRSRFAGEDLKCVMSFWLNMNLRGGVQDGSDDDGPGVWFDFALVDMMGYI